MKFNLLLNDSNIRVACALVSYHYRDTEFLQTIGEQDKFNHTTRTPKEVALQITEFKDLEVTIKSYKPMWRWSKAIAYADYKTSTIYFNAYKDMSVVDRVETIFHESLHLIGFSHNGNYVTAYNLLSVPYKCSSLFVKYLKSIGSV